MLESLGKATCNFCATAEVERRLKEDGFQEYKAIDKWSVEPGKKFYVKKNNSSIFAFVAGSGMKEASGFRIVAAHSDSPCFKLKPNPELYCENGVVELSVEKYGGGILSTWMDRPLSLSGRVLLNSDDPFNPEERIIPPASPSKSFSDNLWSRR